GSPPPGTTTPRGRRAVVSSKSSSDAHALQGAPGILEQGHQPLPGHPGLRRNRPQRRGTLPKLGQELLAEDGELDVHGLDVATVDRLVRVEVEARLPVPTPADQLEGQHAV